MAFVKRIVLSAALALTSACVFAQDITFEGFDIFLAQVRSGEIEGPQDTPSRDRRRERQRDVDTGRGGQPDRGGGRDVPPQGGQPDGPGGRDRSPERRPAPRRHGGGYGGSWDTYLSLSVPLPIIYHDYGNDGSFSGMGGGMGFSMHKVHTDSHFAIMFRMGLALVGAELSDDFEDKYSRQDDVSIGGVTSFYSYFRFGMGGAIEPDREGHFVLIPTAGVGVSFTTMYAEVSQTEVYPAGVYEDKRERTGLDFTFDVFFDLTAGFMFTGNFGLAASCEVAANLIGSGGFADASYTVLPGSFTVTPIVSIFLRF